MPPAASESSLGRSVERVLSPALLGPLGRMRLVVRRAFGPRPGETPVRGFIQPSGLEVERHKAYTLGDEIRHLDWSAYARLDQLLVRQFRAERETPVMVILDSSASMGLPAEDAKFEFAVCLALSLAFVAVRRHNPTRIVVLDGSADGWSASKAVRFPARFPVLAEFCAGLRAEGEVGLLHGLDACTRAHPGPGVAILISDFLLDPGIARSAIHLLAARRFETAALRPLGGHERDPSRLFQRARLRDVETGRERVVRLTPAHLQSYRQALAEHIEGLEAACVENQSLFAACDVDAGLEHCLFSQLPRVGLLR